MNGNDEKPSIKLPPANTLYIGSRHPDGSPVVTAGGRTLSSLPSLRVMNHSPDGFEWGYGGSGPARLALGLLLHATRDNRLTALDLYQAYKAEVVSRWPRQGWVTTRANILAWVTSKVCPLPGPDLGGEGGDS